MSSRGHCESLVKYPPPCMVYFPCEYSWEVSYSRVVLVLVLEVSQMKGLGDRDFGHTYGPKSGPCRSFLLATVTSMGRLYAIGGDSHVRWVIRHHKGIDRISDMGKKGIIHGEKGGILRPRSRR